MAIQNANDHPFKVALITETEGVIYANSHPYKVALEDGKIGFEAVIVDELPETGDPSYIYFILKESTPEGDIYDEWMWALQPNGEYGWSHIGVTDTVEIKLYSSTGNHTDGAMTQKAVTQALNTKQNTLTFDNTPTEGSTNPVTSDGIKTYVDNNRAFQPYPSSVRTNGTTQQFLNDLVALHADVGTAYLGTVNLSDLPESLTQEEVEAYVYNDYTVWAFLRSADTEPYQWWTCSYDYQGWTPFGKMYSAGTGLNLDNNTNQFSVNTSVIQEKLTAGTGIDITNNTISATNTGKARLLTSADYNWNSSTNTATEPYNCVAMWLLPAGFYTMDSSVQVKNGKDQAVEAGTQKFYLIGGYPGTDRPVMISNSSGYYRGVLTSSGNLDIKSHIITDRDLENNLTTTGAGHALDARQGKALKDLIDAIPAYADFIGTDGTTAGTHGLVPAPTTADGDKYLKGDGTWAVVSQPHTLTDAEYDALWSNSNPLNDLLENIVSGQGV